MVNTLPNDIIFNISFFLPKNKKYKLSVVNKSLYNVYTVYNVHMMCIRYTQEVYL